MGTVVYRRRENFSRYDSSYSVTPYCLQVFHKKPKIICIYWEIPQFLQEGNILSLKIYISVELCLLENRRFTHLVQTLIKDLLLEVSWVKVAYQTLCLHPNCTVCCLSSHFSILKSNKQKLWSNVLLILCFI